MHLTVTPRRGMTEPLPPVPRCVCHAVRRPSAFPVKVIRPFRPQSLGCEGHTLNLCAWVWLARNFCSLSGKPAWVECTADLRCAPYLRPVGMFSYLSPRLLRSGCSCGSTVRDACSRTDVLSVPEPARSVALAVRCWTRAGWRWGTGRPRLAIAHGAVEPRPRPTRLGMLARWGIGSAGVHDSRAERFLPGPVGHVPFSFPRFAPHRLARTNLPLCGMFALRRGIYRCPNY